MERQKFRSETGAPRYPRNDLFCLSFSPFFGKDTFGLTSSFQKTLNASSVMTCNHDI